MVNKNRMYIFKGGTWSQSSNFYLKWSFFFTIAQNRINKKLQEFICKFICEFILYIYSCAWRHSWIIQNFLTS